MPTARRAPANDEQYRKDFRAIFADTGQRTLNALLIVSGGATVAFLSFLGSAFKDVNPVRQIGYLAAKGFILAIQLFVASVASCVLAYGTTYLGHGAYHFGHNKTGLGFMIIAAILALGCIATFVFGSYAAIGAFSRILIPSPAS